MAPRTAHTLSVALRWPDVDDRAAVDMQDLPGDVGSVLAGQEHVSGGDLSRLPRASERRVETEARELVCWQGGVDERGPDRSRCDGVDADAARGQGESEGTGERDDRAVGRRVGDRLAGAGVGLGRCGVDDAAARAQVRKSGLGHDELGEHDGVEHRSSFGRVDLRQGGLVHLRPGVVDQHVQMPEGPERQVDHCTGMWAFVADVAGDQLAAPPLRFDEGLRLLGV